MALRFSEWLPCFDKAESCRRITVNESLIASIRASLQVKSNEELNQLLASGKSPEEIEAARQILDERRRKGLRPILALASALVIGALAAAFAWWQLGDGIAVVLASIVGAVLGFASWYIPGLIPFSRP
jgi:hypothetical protein